MRACQWGVENLSNRANRDKQLLAQEGFLRKLDRSEMAELFTDLSEAVYEVKRPLKTDLFQAA